MSKFKEVCTQLTKDTPIEPRMGQIASVLMMKFKDALCYGSTTAVSPYTLTYLDMVQFMRNVQELYTCVTESMDMQGKIDLNRFKGGIQTITNSNPVSSIMAIRHTDTYTPVTAMNIPARSCNLDLTCGNPQLLPLVIAASSKACSDADYLMCYRHNPTSEYDFYFNPLHNNPMHCLFIHPRQLPVADYNAITDEDKKQLRVEHVEPYWTREIRLSPKIADYRIEV